MTLHRLPHRIRFNGQSEVMRGLSGNASVGGRFWLICPLANASDVPRKVDVMLRNLLITADDVRLPEQLFLGLY